MAFTGWATFAGVEMINDARAWTYCQKWGVPFDCGPCDGLWAALGHPQYTSPDEDDAPWYDPSRPESARVLGFVGLAFDGMQSSPTERSTTRIIGDGALIGPLRLRQREVRFRVLAISLDDCAASYALEYFCAMMRGRTCAGAACAGDALCFYSCCPDCNTRDTRSVIPPAYVPPAPGEREARTLYDVGLIDGPTEVSREYMYGADQSGCAEPAGCDGANPTFSVIEFTVAAGKPWLYHTPQTSPASGWFDLAQGQFVPGYDPDAIYAACVTAAPCTTDPLCLPPELPALLPLPVDPCYPVGPFNARRTMLTIRPQEVPEWFESVPIVEIQTGDAELRRVTVRFYSNPIGIPCDLQSPDPCSACADINIAYLPKGASVIIDGRTARASMECSGGTGRPALIGPQGRAFEWPTFTCGGGWCIEIVSSSVVSASARVRVQIAARSDAA